MSPWEYVFVVVTVFYGIIAIHDIRMRLRKIPVLYENRVKTIAAELVVANKDNRGRTGAASTGLVFPIHAKHRASR